MENYDALCGEISPVVSAWAEMMRNINPPSEYRSRLTWDQCVLPAGAATDVESEARRSALIQVWMWRAMGLVKAERYHCESIWAEMLMKRTAWGARKARMQLIRKDIVELRHMAEWAVLSSIRWLSSERLAANAAIAVGCCWDYSGLTRGEYWRVLNPAALLEKLKG